jgi:phage terminase small subunit
MLQRNGLLTEADTDLLAVYCQNLGPLVGSRVDARNGIDHNGQERIHPSIRVAHDREDIARRSTQALGSVGFEPVRGLADLCEPDGRERRRF